jgi:hypothetical protein
MLCDRDLGLRCFFFTLSVNCLKFSCTQLKVFVTFFLSFIYSGFKGVARRCLTTTTYGGHGVVYLLTIGYE